MPKDEFDFEDPFELNGMALMTHEDTAPAMAECFIEEFIRMGYGADQLLALFRNPFYVGPNRVYQNRGEAFVRGIIAEVFARWGRQVVWGKPGSERSQNPTAPLQPVEPHRGSGEGLTDPLGGPIPTINS